AQPAMLIIGQVAAGIALAREHPWSILFVKETFGNQIAAAVVVRADAGIASLALFQLIAGVVIGIAQLHAAVANVPGPFGVARFVRRLIAFVPVGPLDFLAARIVLGGFTEVAVLMWNPPAVLIEVGDLDPVAALIVDPHFAGVPAFLANRPEVNTLVNQLLKAAALVEGAGHSCVSVAAPNGLVIFVPVHCFHVTSALVIAVGDNPERLLLEVVIHRFDAPAPVVVGPGNPAIVVVLVKSRPAFGAEVGLVDDAARAVKRLDYLGIAGGGDHRLAELVEIGLFYDFAADFLPVRANNLGVHVPCGPAVQSQMANPHGIAVLVIGGDDLGKAAVVGGRLAVRPGIGFLGAPAPVLVLIADAGIAVLVPAGLVQVIEIGLLQHMPFVVQSPANLGVAVAMVRRPVVGT